MTDLHRLIHDHDEDDAWFLYDAWLKGGEFAVTILGPRPKPSLCYCHGSEVCGWHKLAERR